MVGDKGCFLTAVNTVALDTTDEDTNDASDAITSLMRLLMLKLM